MPYFTKKIILKSRITLTITNLELLKFCFTSELCQINADDHYKTSITMAVKNGKGSAEDWHGK